MRALVTGATGFLGSHLVERLVDDGADVAVLVRPTTDPWRISRCLEQITPIPGDLTKLDECSGEIARFAPDVVFHLGWHGVDNAHRNDVRQIEVNLGATARLAQLAIRVGCRAFVGTGSQAEYGPQNCRLPESAATMPTTMYGAAKLAAYHLCRVMMASSRVRFAWVRVFSCYGPKDNPGWLIPSLIESLLTRRRMPLTAGEQLWDCTYAADAAQAIALVGSSELRRGRIQLGFGQSRRAETHCRVHSRSHRPFASVGIWGITLPA